MALILFLHGASSSGKSTLAHALRQLSARPFLHLSIDHLRDSGAWKPDCYPDWSAARPAFFAGYHAALAGFADAGNDLIVEHILDTPGWHRTLQTAFGGHDVLFVALHTPLETLRSRESARADRPVGSAQSDYHRIHVGLRYDLCLDGTRAVDESAALILQRIASPLPRSAFFDR